MRQLIIFLSIIIFAIPSFANEYIFREIDTSWGTSKTDILNFESNREDSKLISKDESFLGYKLDSDPLINAVVYHFNDYQLHFTIYYSFVEPSQVDNNYQTFKNYFESGLGKPTFIKENECNFLLNEDTTLVIHKEKVGDTPNASISLLPVSDDFNITLKEQKKPNSSTKINKEISEFKKIDVVDFKLDYDLIKGNKIGVSGVGTYLMGNLFIGKEFFDGNFSIPVETEKLSRDQRKFIMTHCTEGCDITVYGVAGEVNFQEGIIAQRLE